LHPVSTPEGLRIITMIRDASPEVAALERLKASVDERDVLLRETNHRFRNYMQLLSGVLSSDDAGSQAALDKARVQVRAIWSIHEGLAAGQRRGRLDLASFLHALVTEIGMTRPHQREGGRIEAKLQLEPVDVPSDVAFILGRLVHEMYLGAAARAATAGVMATLVVALTRRGEEIVLRFTDDAPASDADTTGHRVALGEAPHLVRQLGGSLEIAREGGTTVIVPMREDAGAADEGHS
jgi:two-component sensor histidine kinase